jgi:hypothetical protein
MTIFLCQHCMYSTSKKSNYSKHLRTKKHRDNFSGQHLNLFQSIPSLTNPSNPLKSEENGYKVPHKLDPKKFICPYCNKHFSRKDNLIRHQKSYCSNANTDLGLFQKKMIEQDKKIEEMKEREEKLMNQIEMLLTKVGNNNTTNITTTNNIQINNYGSEDLSHITNAFKTKLLKGPYAMIPRMIEAVHFNDDKPENNNIMIANQRDNKIKIFENGKWIYKDKKRALKDLMDKKYYILDEHFNQVTQEELTDFHKKNYIAFSTRYEDDSKDLLDDLKSQTELLILNNKENKDM